MADEDFVICGYVQSENTLILGQYNANDLTYQGSVNYGVKQDFLKFFKCKIINNSPFPMTPSINADLLIIVNALN